MFVNINTINARISIIVFSLLMLLNTMAFASALTSDNNFEVEQDYFYVPATIDGDDCKLEVKVFKPADEAQHPTIILTHGRNGYTPTRNPLESEYFSKLLKTLASKGYVAAYIVRRGYGNSTGTDVEGKYSVGNSYKCGLEMAKDMKATVDYIRNLPYVDKNKIILGGQSAGGLATIASASQNFEGVVGYINFAGYSVDVNSMDLIDTSKEFGKTAKMPMLWLYSSGDQFLPYVDVEGMNKAFQKSGGNSKLIFTKYVHNGHNIMKRYNEWFPIVDKFFDSINFY